MGYRAYFVQDRTNISESGAERADLTAFLNSLPPEEEVLLVVTEGQGQGTHVVNFTVITNTETEVV